MFFRTLLFKIFNRIKTWERLQRHFGYVSYREYTFEHYDKVLAEAMDEGEPIFSNAYIMPSSSRHVSYRRKHRNYLQVLEQMMEDEVALQLGGMKTMQQAFGLLRSYPLIGDFLGYQYIIDLNYSEILNFSEMEFVVPGPGARDGIHKCFQSLGGLNEVDIIALMADRQEEEFERLGLAWRSLWGRPLQLIDCQNLFCEVDKYARMAHPDIRGLSGRTRIKQRYVPTFKSIVYWYPPKWALNDKIGQKRGGRHGLPVHGSDSR